MALLFGESVAGEYIGDCGMRSLRREVGVRAMLDRGNGDGGTRGAEEAFRTSQLHEQLLPALEGCDVGDDLPDDLSEKLALLLVAGLETAGDRALRKSVYAIGGVIGVLMSSSSLTMSAHPGRGLRGSSDGKTPAD